MRQAEEIDTAVDRAEEFAAIAESAAAKRDLYGRLRRLESACDATKVVAKMGPQLARTLLLLGGTPAARARVKKDKPAASRLAALRAAGSSDG